MVELDMMGMLLMNVVLFGLLIKLLHGGLVMTRMVVKNLVHHILS